MTEYGDLPFAEAIVFFREKLSMPSDTWSEVWQSTHDAVFVIAGAVEEDLLYDIRMAVEKAKRGGIGFGQFKSSFRQTVKKTGWQHTGSTAWRAGVIYDTNIRQSYNAGRYRQLQLFAFWEYVHSDSLNPRLDHKSKHGLILPKDADFWVVWFPQNGWGCKCKVIGRTREYMLRHGRQVSEEPVIETYKWVDKVTGEELWVPVGIDPGFDYAPGATSHAERVTMVQKQKRYRRLLEKSQGAQ